MRYKEIISRVLLTIGMLVILRLGYFIALPGIDLQHMPTLAPCGYQGRPVLLLSAPLWPRVPLLLQARILLSGHA